MGVQCSGMLLNTVAAEKYGLKIDHQLTWEEIIELGKELHEKDHDAYFFSADHGHVLNALLAMIKQRTGGQVINDDFKMCIRDSSYRFLKVFSFDGSGRTMIY